MRAKGASHSPEIELRGVLLIQNDGDKLYLGAQKPAWCTPASREVPPRWQVSGSGMTKPRPKRGFAFLEYVVAASLWELGGRSAQYVA